MAPVAKLYTVPTQATGKRIRSVAALTGIDLELPADYVHYTTNQTAPFLAKFPAGKIPAFEGADGFNLFEGVAIARYVAALAPNSTLLGSSLKEQALIDQWVHYADTEIQVHTTAVSQLLNHKIPYNKVVDTTHREQQQRALTVLENHLKTRTYLITERLTLADISVATVLQNALSGLLDSAWRSSHPNSVRFFETVANHPTLKPIFGPIVYVEKSVQYVPPAKEKAKDKPKEEKKVEKKKEEKPKKAAEEDDDDDEPLVPEEPKAKNPLDLLPKSTFNLEDWKRAYSNMDTRGDGGSLQWFYEKFDAEGYSIWRVDFKYNEELTQVFMSSNQIGGFFNRLEGSRKYLFGSVGVLGSANNSAISGAFILRGQDHKAVVEAAPDWESYEYKKIDLSDAKDKEFFEAALAWDLEIDGKKWADGKAFK